MSFPQRKELAINENVPPPGRQDDNRIHGMAGLLNALMVAAMLYAMCIR
jgi:hypothetical protein